MPGRYYNIIPIKGIKNGCLYEQVSIQDKHSVTGCEVGRSQALHLAAHAPSSPIAEGNFDETYFACPRRERCGKPFNRLNPMQKDMTVVPTKQRCDHLPESGQVTPIVDQVYDIHGFLTIDWQQHNCAGTGSGGPGAPPGVPGTPLDESRPWDSGGHFPDCSPGNRRGGGEA